MKKFLIGCFLFAFGASAQASYLYWQIDGTKDIATRPGWTYTFGNQYDAGHVVAVDGSGNRTVLNLADSSGNTTDYSDVFDTDPAVINLSQLSNDGAGYSYYIEYMKYDESGNASVAAATIGGAAYSSLSDHIAGTMSDIPGAVAWHGGAMATPEPTSAMLMLLGVAGLALRRKQRKAA